MGLHDDLFDFDNDGDVDFDDDFMFMTMMDQLNHSGGGDNSSGDGRYIATCVYGSYDCPEVWTLRRFRDFRLAQSMLGRTFIRAYYAISPTVVSIFGSMSGLQHFWRRILDSAVSKLKLSGVSDKPYQDINWRKEQFDMFK